MKKQATIKEVATLAGVSLATVSRVLNDATYPVSEDLKKKVKDAAEQLQYVPNAMARSLRGSGRQDIGLILPNITNPFYLQAIMGISDVLNQQGYSLVLYNTMRDVEQEKFYLRQLYERQVKGVILSSVDVNADLVNEYMKKGMKFVLLDQKLSGAETTVINFDNRTGARMATEYLIGLGHKRIAFGTLPITRRTRSDMHQGYLDALATAGLPYDETLVYERKLDNPHTYNDLEVEVGKKIAEDFMNEGCPATAIVCVNDMLAIGVIRTLIQKGVKVPEDVSVFGFDDVPFAEAFLPPLTTVHYPAAESGRLAALALLDALQNDQSEMAVSMKMTPRLVVRDTVAVPK